MKKSLAVSCLVLACVVLAAMSASAGTVNLRFDGTGNSQYQGEYSYPYLLSVNGQADQWMMCISYYQHITSGETWRATVSPIDTNNVIEEQAAWLFMQARKDGGKDPAINAAAWFLMEGAPGLDAEAQAWLALAQSQTFHPGEFDSVVLYTPIPGSESGNLGTAQNFLGSTPEPGTLLLVGSGLLGLWSRRKRSL